MGRFQPRQKVGIKFMGGEGVLITNPEKGRAGKRKANYSDSLKYMSTGDLK